MSTRLVLQKITSLKTRHLYRVIDQAPTWDNRIKVRDWDAIQEIIFWKFNFHRLNERRLYHYDIPFILVASDASETGVAAHVVPTDRRVAYRNLFL